MQHVFIIGSKGIPGSYGGYETFVDKLTEYHQNNHEIKYHVACKNIDSDEFEYNGARCFNVAVKDCGSAQAVFYDVKALISCCNYIKENKISNPIVYILACRIGPFARHYMNIIRSMGGRVFINPDGHEWKRRKWNRFIRKYWKISEKLMIKNADLVVCDSKCIEDYVKKEYVRFNPKTTYISYGAEIAEKSTDRIDELYDKWIEDNNLEKNEYYLVVGRFVPENNFETILREFMASDTTKKLCVISTRDDAYYKALQSKLKFEEDSRIKFVGTVYNKELLTEIRANAYAYIHGHEVGGTNPSLLEALGSTNLNLVYGVNFNREVCQDSALFWNKEEGNLAKLISKAEGFSDEIIKEYGAKSTERIKKGYSWNYIAEQYLRLFLDK